MSTKTKNYGMIKPDYTDWADIQILNENLDIADAELKKGENHRNNTDNPHNVTAVQVGVCNPNLFDDGDFQSWELGTSFSNITGREYIATMWQIWVSDTFLVSSASKISDTGGIKIVNGNSAGDVFGLVGLIEHGTIKPNTTYTVSVHGNFGTTSPNFGIADYGKPTFANGSTKISDNIYTFTFTTPSTLDSHFFCSLSTDNMPANAEVDIFEMKLEEGNQFTGFQHQKLNDVISRVMRYFQRNFDFNTYIYASDIYNGSTVALPISFHGQMRTSPTVSVISGADLTGAIGRTWDLSITPVNLHCIDSHWNGATMAFDNGVVGVTYLLVKDVVQADARM